ncbi:hypothetical protein KCU99_g2106, partial [Aureobasidium melanogenum]
QLKTGHPVRSAIHKQLNGRLVLRWVTTWESLLLYVLFFCKNSRLFFPCVAVGREIDVSLVSGRDCLAWSLVPLPADDWHVEVIDTQGLWHILWQRSPR